MYVLVCLEIFLRDLFLVVILKVGVGSMSVVIVNKGQESKEYICNHGRGVSNLWSPIL